MGSPALSEQGIHLGVLPFSPRAPAPPSVPMSRHAPVLPLIVPALAWVCLAWVPGLSAQGARAAPPLPQLPPPPTGVAHTTIFDADRVHVAQGWDDDLPTQAAGAGAGGLVDHVIPAGPGGTGTDFDEPIQYQLPAGYDPDGPPLPMVIAYHGFGSSAGSVAVQSTLDEQCNNRGWVYLSVTGMFSELFGSPPCQQHIEVAIQWMLDTYNVDPDRLYMVGFSMGGGITANFAARRRDPDGIMLAAIGLVSATSDWAASHAFGTAGVQALLENPLNFGAPPAAAPFAYESASGLSFDVSGPGPGLGPLQPDRSLSSNLGTTPTWMVWDLADPVLMSAQQNPARADFLQSLGGEVTVKTVFNTTDPVTGAPAAHSWAVLKEGQLMNFFDGRVVDRRPRRFDALLAEDGAVGEVQVTRRDVGELGALSADLESGLSLAGIANVATAGVDAGGRPATLRVSVDTTDDDLALRLHGFASRPSFLTQGPQQTLVPDVLAEPLQDALVVPVAGGATSSFEATLHAEPGWTATLLVTPAHATAGQPVQLALDGPPGATSAWLIVGTEERLVPVLGGGVRLGLDPRPPSLLRILPVDTDGDTRLSVKLPAALTAAGSHVHLQALFRGRSGALAVSQVARLEFD